MNHRCLVNLACRAYTHTHICTPWLRYTSNTQLKCVGAPWGVFVSIVYVCVCVCLCASPQLFPSITPQHSSLHQCCHKIMWQGVDHARAWSAMGTRGFLAEHFCEQHQGEGNSREHSTVQINLTTARPHTSLLFSTITLWPLDSSNHTSGVNSDPCKKEPCGGHMQTKCSAIPWESHSWHLAKNPSIHPLSVPKGLYCTVG